MAEDTETSSVEPTTKISRREFLKISGVAVGGVVSAGLACRFGSLLDTPETQRREVLLARIDVEIDGKIFRLGKSELPFPNNPEEFPDGRTSWIQRNDKLLVFGSSETNGVRFEGPSLDKLGKPTTVLIPDKTHIELGFNRYRALSTVFERKPGELIGFYHEEFTKSESSIFPFIARIGVAVSQDDGFTWVNKGPVIEGHSIEMGLDKAQGAGHPSAIVTGEGRDATISVYYTAWEENDAICVTRAPLYELENPDAWQKWYKGSFNTPGLGGESTPVIESPDGAAALVHVSFNRALGKYLAIFERGYEKDAGFYITTSRDGLNWGEQKMIAKFPQSHLERKYGDTWYSYPTLISGSQFLTDRKGFLLCSKGKWKVSEEVHRGILIPFEIIEPKDIVSS